MQIKRISPIFGEKWVVFSSAADNSRGIVDESTTQCLNLSQKMSRDTKEQLRTE